MSNWKKKTCKYVLAVLLFVLLVGIADVRPVQAAVKLSDSSINLCVGDKYQLKVTGTSKKVTWKSSKTSVAKVTSKGLVTARGAGSATITATVSKKSYKCKVKVNKTFKVNQTAISIKKNTNLTAYLSVNGALDRKIADGRICSVKFGNWDGDNMPITIVPKKVGTTTIKFTNTANDEYCTLKVRVTALPVNATFQAPIISSGSDTFIVGENEMIFVFQLNRDAKSTSLRIYNANGETVRTINVGSLDAKRMTSVLWDGLDENGTPVDGTFKYAVVADGTKTTGGSGKVLARSPFGKGDGTENNPYLVSNLTELCMIKEYNGAHFAQDADIDFNYTSLAPSFDEKTPFTGTFDGSHEGTQYRMINFCGSNSVFGSIGTDGNVKNVSMKDCVLNAVGSLLADSNSGTIDGCTIDGEIICNTGNQAAMLVMNNSGIIRACKVSGHLAVKAVNSGGAITLKAGGIAVQNSGTIAQCTSSLQIMQSLNVASFDANVVHEICSGGIVAENATGAIVTLCIFEGTISTTVEMSDSVVNVVPDQLCKIYSGYVAGRNNGYIGNCVNASTGGSWSAQGTGTGTVQ